MASFLVGFLSSLTATALIFVLGKWVWPNLKDQYLYSGIRINGLWEITEKRNGKRIKVGQLELKQYGKSIQGDSQRTKTRDGKKSERKFGSSRHKGGASFWATFEDRKQVGVFNAFSVPAPFKSRDITL